VSNRTVYAVRIAVSVGYFLCMMCLVLGVEGYEGIAVLYWRCMDEMYTLGVWPRALDEDHFSVDGLILENQVIQ